MNKTNATTITSVLKTLTLVLALTITSQTVYAQHTQGPTVEGVALPNLGGGEEGEITEEQIIEVQRQCNESLVKEYLYNGSGGKVSLVGKMEINDKIGHPDNNENRTTLYMVSAASSPVQVRFGQILTSQNTSSTQVNSYAALQLSRDFKTMANLLSTNAASFLMTVDRKWDLDGLGAIVNVKNVVTQLKIARFEEDSINFKAKQQDGSKLVVFSYPTAKYISCLKSGVASLAK